MASVWIALKGYAPYFWREWVTGVDHKRIGVIYMPLAMLMMPRGFNDAIIMRSQQAFVFREAEPSRTRNCIERLEHRNDRFDDAWDGGATRAVSTGGP